MQNSLEHTDSMGEVNLGTLSVVTAQSIGVSKDSANTKKPLQRYKSKAHKVVVGLIISISAVMFGCSIR